MVRNRIAALRKQNNMNQRELSEQIGVAQATVSAWETGRNEPDNETIQKLAELFDVNFGYVAGYEQLTISHALKAQQKKELERDALRQWELEESEQDEAMNDILKEEEERDYLDNGSDLFYEAFALNRACEYMSQDQRKRALTILKAAFPKAFQSSTDPD